MGYPHVVQERSLRCRFYQALLPQHLASHLPSPSQFDLPFLPLNPPLGLPFLLGTVVMVAGLALYNGPQWIGPVRGMISNWLNTEEGVRVSRSWREHASLTSSGSCKLIDRRFTIVLNVQLSAMPRSNTVLLSSPCSMIPRETAHRRLPACDIATFLYWWRLISTLNCYTHHPFFGDSVCMVCKRRHTEASARLLVLFGIVWRDCVPEFQPV